MWAEPVWQALMRKSKVCKSLAMKRSISGIILISECVKVAQRMNPRERQSSSRSGNVSKRHQGVGSIVYAQVSVRKDLGSLRASNLRRYAQCTSNSRCCLVHRSSPSELPWPSGYILIMTRAYQDNVSNALGDRAPGSRCMVQKVKWAWSRYIYVSRLDTTQLL